MGDCYSVEMRIKAEGSRRELAMRMHKWMKEAEKGTDEMPGVNWSWAYYRRHGARPESLGGIVKILLASPQGCFRHWVEEGFDHYRSDFSATYSWASVMREAFRKMAPWLADGSCLHIDRDNGADDLVVDEGEVWEKTSRLDELVTGMNRGKERT